MKNMTRKLLALILALATMGSLLTVSLAAGSDILVLSTSPAAGIVSVAPNVLTRFAVEPHIVNASGEEVSGEYSLSYSWTLNGVLVSINNYYDFYQRMEYDTYTLVCTVSAIHKVNGTQKVASATWYPTNKNLSNIYLTVTQNIGSFYFDDDATYTGTSVFSEICKLINFSNTSDPSQYTVTFTPTSGYVATLSSTVPCALTDLDKLFLTLHTSGQWVAQYTVTKGQTTVLTGVLTIEIEPYVGMDAFISATPGSNAVIDKSVFTDFWYKKFSGISTLDTVLITGASGMSGVLCYNHKATETSHTSTSSLTMYAAPTGRQLPLADLTFIPTKTGSKYPTGTVTVSFQVRGKDENKNTVYFTGNVIIMYTNSIPSDINYNCTGTYVVFDSTDFDAVYRSVTGTTAKNPSYTVRFLDLPKYGTLYRGYSSANYGTLGSVALTEQNRNTLNFYSNATGETSLDYLAYVPSTHNKLGDSATYAVYNGNSLLYVGKINFSSRELIITYTTSAPTLTFSSIDFFGGNSPLLSAQYIMFGTPSYGTLFRDYANRIYVQPGDYFSYTTDYGVHLLDNVTFVPQKDFTGVVEIPFSAQALLGGSLSGKVRIYVVKDAFADVDPNHWAAPYINRLYASGIIKGTSATTFSPSSNMKYGEALKMILIAAGYPKQTETGGPHWASAYLDLAYRNNIVSSRNIDLDATVDRDTIAEIAAKALGLSKAASINNGIVPPADSTNGYVYALYNAGILNGSFIGGINYYQGNKPITRAEVAKIICAINDYKN